MHRTQIYFEEDMFEEIKQRASVLGISVSAYIRELIKKELKKDIKNELNIDDFAGIWKDRGITLENIREKAWK